MKSADWANALKNLRKTLEGLSTLSKSIKLVPNVGREIGIFNVVLLIFLASLRACRNFSSYSSIKSVIKPRNGEKPMQHARIIRLSPNCFACLVLFDQIDCLGDA